ncbi:MAG: hypothetical protein QFX38_03045 [Methanothermobacter sp.]|nr:hypothetical protein [Methanothermobacter sp.]
MFLKDSEKEELRRLVKACMLEISKLELELENCKKRKDESEKLERLEKELAKKDERIKELEKFLKEKDKLIENLNKILSEKEAQIEELERIRGYFNKLTAKPKKNLTSFQSQIYRLLPKGKATTEKLHSFIQDIGFKDLKYENMLQILRNLERKGYFRSYNRGDDIIWEKIEK